VSRVAIAVAVASVGLAACGGGSSSPPTAASVATSATSANATQPPKPKSKPAKPSKPKPSPGSLPQTDQRPSADTPAFHAEMQALWTGVQQNSVAKAMPAFFPEGAYIQIKAIGDARGDYVGRLVADYRLDLGAAHQLLGGDPGSAHLVGVNVPASYAHWVPPGVCYNRVGYYELPSARVVYRQGAGAVHSFGIASMISWRGVWYVVHLGAVVRSGSGGVVDDPSAGVGGSAPSSTC
jgi:hypothetical protein